MWYRAEESAIDLQRLEVVETTAGAVLIAPNRMKSILLPHPYTLQAFSKKSNSTLF